LLILSPTLGLLLDHALPLMRLLQYALAFSSSLVLMVLRLSPTKLLLSLWLTLEARLNFSTLLLLLLLQPLMLSCSLFLLLLFPPLLLCSGFLQLLLLMLLLHPLLLSLSLLLLLLLLLLQLLVLLDPFHLSLMLSLLVVIPGLVLSLPFVRAPMPILGPS